MLSILNNKDPFDSGIKQRWDICRECELNLGNKEQNYSLYVNCNCATCQAKFIANWNCPKGYFRSNPEEMSKINLDISSIVLPIIDTERRNKGSDCVLKINHSGGTWINVFNSFDKATEALNRVLDYFGHHRYNNIPENIDLSDLVPFVIDPNNYEYLILKHNLALGDLIVFSALIRDIKLTHPHLKIIPQTWSSEVWENNPYINRGEVPANGKVKILDCSYPSINRSDKDQIHFIEGFSTDVMNDLNLKWPVTKIAGDLHLSPEEIANKPVFDKPYWILIAPGGKSDHTAKWWNPLHAQKVVDQLKDKYTFVRIGHQGHFHPRLQNTIDLVGKTSLRDLFRYVYHSAGVITPVSGSMHIAACFDKPAIVIAGGREPKSFTDYKGQRHFNNVGHYDCCKTGGCWRSRCQPMQDDAGSNNNVCVKPVKLSLPFIYDQIVYPDLSIAQCMNDITPEMVIEAIKSYEYS